MSTIIKNIASEKEKNNRLKLKNLFEKNPIFENEKINNIGVFLVAKNYLKSFFLMKFIPKFKMSMV